MAAQDIKAEVNAWVGDEIGKQCFGEDFGWAVTWDAVPMPNGQGGAVLVPMWSAVITARNPLLGQGPLYHLAKLGALRPGEADVRREVADGLRQLRELAAKQTAGQNGHAKRAVSG